MHEVNKSTGLYFPTPGNPGSFEEGRAWEGGAVNNVLMVLMLLPGESERAKTI